MSPDARRRSDAPGAGGAGSPRGGRRKRLLLAAGSVVVALLLVEVGLRFLLFADAARRAGLGWRARNAALYTAREAGEESWRLKTLLEGPRAGRPNPNFDARFGWLKPEIDPVTLAHASEECLRGRRPVLLFGDSYAQCVGSDCWQELLEASELGLRFLLLNYGVGGFGLDQMSLLLGPVLDRFAGQDPLVVIAILVDDDLDRCDLALRGFPKPRFTVQEGRLVLHPLEHTDAKSYVRDHPPGIWSYAWRWFLFGSGLVPRSVGLAWVGQKGHVERKQELARRLLVRMREELDGRGLDSFFWLFHARGSLEDRDLLGWQEPFLRATFEELGIRWVSSRPFLRSYLDRTGAPLDDLYLPEGPGMNHYTPLANGVVFGALRAGLGGRFEPVEARGER